MCYYLNVHFQGQRVNFRRQSKVTDPIASNRICSKYSGVLTDANFLYYTRQFTCESIVEVPPNAKQNSVFGTGCSNLPLRSAVKSCGFGRGPLNSAGERQKTRSE